APELPVWGPLPFLVAGVPEGVRLDAAGIEPLVEPVDELALAGPVGSGDYHDDRELLGAEVEMGLEDPRAKGGELRGVAFLGELLVQFCNLEHGGGRGLARAPRGMGWLFRYSCGLRGGEPRAGRVP